MLKVLAVSLLLTLILEAAFALLWGLRGKRELTIIALVNILTNPVVVLTYHTTTYLFGWSPVIVTAVLEIGAVLVEWRCLHACSEQLKRPFLFALMANAFSYGLGLVIF
ncbi:MAG: hypothetical protein IKU27_05025 [Clostridia bacterium]|nr:hypothetical protein [Clostridia bacterium]